MRPIVAVLAVAFSSERVAGCPEPESDVRSVEQVSVAFVYPNGPGRNSYELVGCGDWQVQKFSTVSARPGQEPCSVVGIREEGGVRVRSAPVPLDPSREASTITFELPAGPLGGIGAEIDLETRIRCLADATTRTGEVCGAVQVARITKVIRPGPAADSGLRWGDAIVSVNGRSGSTREAFERLLVGYVGAQVALEIEDATGRERATRTLTLSRLPERPVSVDDRRILPLARPIPLGPRICRDFTMTLVGGGERVIWVYADGSRCP